ncbi:MAG: hypothetical protein ACT4OM_13405 [Actinomycetota bacterium]
MKRRKNPERQPEVRQITGRDVAPMTFELKPALPFSHKVPSNGNGHGDHSKSHAPGLGSTIAPPTAAAYQWADPPPTEEHPLQTDDSTLLDGTEPPLRRRRRRRKGTGERPPEGTGQEGHEGTAAAEFEARAIRQHEIDAEDRRKDKAAEKRLRRRSGSRRAALRDTAGITQELPQEAPEDVTQDLVQEQDEAEHIRQLRQTLAPAWGWKIRGAGRSSHVSAAQEYQGTTTQACGLFPFVAGSGSPSVGIPLGRHLLFGEPVSLGPFEWLEGGLVTNPGIFVLGSPGVGKSALIKRLLMGGAGYGIRPFVLADLKPDYCYEGGVINELGGQTLKIGRGVDTINPLDTGPLGEAARLIGGKAGEQLAAESRGRRLNALLALLTLVREYPLNNGEQNVLAEIVDVLDEKGGFSVDRQPTVPDVLNFLRNNEALERMMRAADVMDEREYVHETKELRRTLNQLCTGTLKGMFDGQTSRPINLAAPAVGVDISRVSSAGDTIVAAAILSTWAYAFSMIDGAEALAQAGLAPRRRYACVLDEMWRALRGAPGLVEFADALTRVNRAKGVSDIRATHSLADLEALPTAEDRAKARGFVERAGVVVLGGLPPRELDLVSEVVPLSEAEKLMVAGWSAPDSWAAATVHPGRGKYLIKCGQRTGIPVAMTLVGDEPWLYDTDVRMRTGALR